MLGSKRKNSSSVQRVHYEGTYKYGILPASVSRHLVSIVTPPPPPLSLFLGSEVESGVGGMSRVKSFGSFKRDFKLDDVCDYVQTGVQV